MTRVVVNSGVCGMEVIIEVNGVTARKVKIEITSACKLVEALGQSLTEVDPFDVLKGVSSEVYKQAFSSSLHLHATCPVPVAILKAVEVEAEMALPCDAVIHFVIPPGRDIPVIKKKEAKHANN